MIIWSIVNFTKIYMDHFDEEEQILFNEIIVNNPDFIQKFNHADNELTDYLLEHVFFIIKYLFYSKTSSKTELTNLNKCVNLLVINDPKIRKKLISETNFLDFLIDYPREFPKIDHEHRFRYIQILDIYLNEKRLSINKEIATMELFENLVSVCDYQTSFTFLKENFCSLRSNFSNDDFFLEKVPIVDVICKYIIGHTKLNFNAQELITSFLNSSLVSESLTKNALLYSFIEYSFSNKEYGHNFQFLHKIYQMSIKLNALHDTNSKTIELIISSRINDLREIVFTTKNWCESSVISILLISSILTHNPDLWIDNDYDLFYFLVGMLISNPKFSKLHLAILNFFETMKILNKLNSDILYKSHLIQIIIDKYQNRGNCVECAYWGVIRTMSGTITPYVKDADRSVWASLVINKNTEIEQLIQKERKKPPTSIVNERNLTFFFFIIMSIVFLLIAITIKYM